MSSTAFNVVHLGPRGLVVEAIRFIEIDGRLQLAILEWLQLAEQHHLGVLSNVTVCGRRSFIFTRRDLELINEGYLRSRFAHPDRAIDLGKTLMGIAGQVERPRSLKYISTTDPDTRGQFVILPVTVDGVPLYILRVGQW